LLSNTTQGARVFVSAPYDTALRPLLDALEGAGVDAFVSSDVASLGSDVVESARSAIEAADIVLVVLTKQPALNPIFEAGMAAALGKRLILVGEPGATLSMDLRSFVLVQASLEEPAPVVAAIEELVRRPLARSRPPAKATGHPLASDTVDRLLHRLESEPLNERSMISILMEAIEAAGAIPVESSSPDHGWDLGVWSDDLAAIAGNPLVIEVKRELDPRAVDQVRHYLAAQQSASLGLVVYLVEPTDEDLRRALPGAWFPVLVISMQDLIEQLRSQSFAGVVRDLRNRAVHEWPRP
jgi:hypothetical protein